MAYYDALYASRQPIAIDNVGGAGGVADIEITIPKRWDEFWEAVESTGYDVLFTDADGVTILTYERTTWTYATRTGVFQIDNYTLPAEGTCLIWMYFDYSGASDGSSSFAPGALKNGYIDLQKPNDRQKQVSMASEPKGRSRPSREVHKETATETDLFFGPFGPDVLSASTGSYADHSNWEEIDYVQFGVEAATVEQAAEMDETKTRFIQDQDGLVWVKARIKAGTTAADRTAHLKVGTVDPNALTRVIEKKAYIAVKTLVET